MNAAPAAGRWPPGWAALLLCPALGWGEAPVAVMATEATVPEEVIVTAQRREQTLMEVPIAVTVLTGERLLERGALELIDLAQSVPNMTLEVAGTSNSSLVAFIRGVGQQDVVAGFEPGVGLYVDDVWFARPQTAVLDLYDVERIEVLRGPQGTLYGRNTIGGAIRYVTRRLEDTPAVRALARVGNYGMRDAVLSGSTPVGEHLRIGASVAAFTRDGFGRNLHQPGVDHYDKDVRGARVSAELRPADGWLIRLAADWLRDDSAARHGHRLVPGGHSGAPVLDNVYDTRAGNTVPEQDVSAEGLSLTAQWAVTDRLTLRGIAATREDETWNPGDFDGLPTVDLDVPTWYGNEQDSLELQALWEAERWNAVAGVYALDASAGTVFDILPGLRGAQMGVPGLNQQQQGYADTRSWAVFADGTVALTDRWSLSVGGRYTQDRRDARVLRRMLVGGLSGFFGGVDVVAQTFSSFDGAERFDRFTPRVVLQWLPTGAHATYLSWSEGFKGGGFDPRALTIQAPDTDGDGTVSADEVHAFMSFEPEVLESWELGWKATALDGRLSSRLAVFWSDYTDVQIPGAVGADTDGDGLIDTFYGVTTNASEARIRGAEWEGELRVPAGFGPTGAALSFAWALGRVDADYRVFVDATGADVADRRVFQNTPDWTASGTAGFDMPVAWRGRPALLALTTTLSWRDDHSQFSIPDPRLDQPAYALWDVSLTWSETRGRWAVGLHGRNLTDERYAVEGFAFQIGLERNLLAYYGNPRQYWLEVRYAFE